MWKSSGITIYNQAVKACLLGLPTLTKAFFQSNLTKRILSLSLARNDPNKFGICLLVLLPILALGAGKAINETIVLGPYEWAGLARICRQLFERTGFWCIAFGIWAVGISNASDGMTLKQLLRRPHFVMTWAGGTALVASLSVFTDITAFAGTLIDFTALTLLLSGVFVVDLFRANNFMAGTWFIGKSLLVGVAIFSGYTAIGYFHTMIKGALFVLATPEDDRLWAADIFLFGMNHYRALTDWRAANPGIVRGLDIIYIGLLQQICWSAFFFHGARNFSDARRYLLAMFLIYTFGPLVYFIAPSMGPIFYAPQSFSDLRFAAPDTWHLAEFLLANTNATVAGVAHEIAPFGFIAALPSLHVGISLIMLLAMRESLLAIFFNLALLLFTIAATNILGWHYVVDAIAGLILGVLVWWLAIESFAQHNPA